VVQTDEKARETVDGAEPRKESFFISDHEPLPQSTSLQEKPT